MDIADRRQSGAAFNASPNLLAVVSLDGTVKVVNESWQRVLGYRAEELVGRPLTKLVVSSERFIALRLLSPRVLASDAAPIELALQAKDGTFRCFLWERRYIQGENTMFLAGNDVTERKKIEVTDNLKAYQLYSEATRQKKAS